MKKLFISGLFLATTLLLIVFLVSDNAKQTKKKNYVIGIVNPNPGMKKVVTGFIEGLSSQGYVAGKNVTFSVHETKKGMEDAINKMIDQEVDLIYTLTTPATRLAKKATEKKKTPVVFTMHDPVKSGIIQSLSDPKANLTGVQLRGSTPKTVEWLLAAFPGIKNIFVPVKYDTKAAKQSLSDLESTATQVGINITVSEVNSEEELNEALSSMPADVDAVFILHSILIYSYTDNIIDAAIARNIPISSGSSLHEKGITLTFGHSSSSVGKQASRLASRILGGKSIAETPAEMANFQLGINLKTAEASGIEIPNEVLQQADHIVR